jgi:hypothetical protein
MPDDFGGGLLFMSAVSLLQDAYRRHAILDAKHPKTKFPKLRKTNCEKGGRRAGKICSDSEAPMISQLIALRRNDLSLF